MNFAFFIVEKKGGDPCKYFLEVFNHFLKLNTFVHDPLLKIFSVLLYKPRSSYIFKVRNRTLKGMVNHTY